MEELAQLCAESPAAARQRLRTLARERGAAALAILQGALEVPTLAEAAIEALAEVPDQGAWDILEQIARQGPAGRRKAARRAQHRLRSRGFLPQDTAVPPSPAPTFEQVRASFFDRIGAQFLRLVQPAALGMVRYASFLVGPEGLLECEYALVSRIDLDHGLAAEDEQFGEDLIEVSPAYIARRVRQAVERSRAGGHALPQAYSAAAQILEGIPDDVLPACLAAAADTAAVSPSQANALVRHRSMVRWLLLDKEMSSYAEDWLRIVQSQPLLTQEGLPNLAALQSRGKLAARIIGDRCDEAMVRRLAEQLTEQARLLAALGEEKLAAVALGCAAGLEKNPGPDNPFLRALVDESMEILVQIAQDREEEEEEEDGPWVSTGPGALWVPRPAEPKDEEEESPARRLWLPGQPE